MSAIFIGGGAAEEPAKRSTRQLLRLIRDAIALVWRAAPREFLFAGSLQAFAGVATAAQLLLAKNVLDAVLEADRTGSSFRDALPTAAAFLGITLAVTAAGVIQREVQRLLALPQSPAALPV